MLGINFNMKKYKAMRGNVEEQYWTLCESIWPGLERGSFSICECSLAYFLHSITSGGFYLAPCMPCLPGSSNQRALYQRSDLRCRSIASNPS